MIKPNGSDAITKLVGLGIVSSVVLLWASTAQAQRRPIADETLGTERTIVTPVRSIRGRPGDRIDGGARRGNNLFHSFRDFQVDATRGVYFIDPGVENIVGRVTGGIQSDILGTLGVLGGDANLFLINPSGILFGENARLDVGGSFVATTANAIGFDNQGFFGVADPNAPALLTVQPSAFLFNQINPGTIENRSRASDGSGNGVLGLRVPNRQNLVFLGGTVVNQGNLNAFGGRVELGSVGELGTVGLATDGSLSFPNEIARADVRITDGSQIDVASNNRGNIAINARNIDISGGSLLRAGIFSGLGTINSQAGDVVLNGTGEIQVRQSSLITNNVGADGIGNSGNINITAGSLFVTGRAQLQAVTFGQGNAGDVIITATDGVVFNDSVAFSTVGSVTFNGVPVGEGGDVIITTDSLEVVNGAQLQASTFGQGNAGRVIINATDGVVFNGTSAGGLSSAAFSNVGNDAVGDGGNIDITAGSLFVTGDAQLSTSTSGQGNAGNVIINADDRVMLDNSTVYTGGPSVIFEGEVKIGNAGSIEINTDSLEARNGARLGTYTLGQGDAGNVIIRADDRVIFNSGGVFATGVGSSEGETRGNAGNIEIYTDSLEVRNRASLGTSTFGQGDAGNVIIRADDRVLFDGSTVFTTAVGPFEGETRGTGGNVEIYTDSLEVRNRAGLQTSTFGQGDAGNVIIHANTFEATDGGRVITTTGGSGQAGNITLNVTARITLLRTSGLFANTEPNSSGQGGTIRIRTRELEMFDRARVSVNNQESSRAGNIDITAQSVELDRGRLTAETNAIADGGNITLRDTDLLILRNGSDISTTAGTDETAESGGNGGNITIDADFIVAFPNENSDIQADAFTGSGGNINITTEGLFGIEDRGEETEFSDITASSDLGVQGTIEINTPDVDPSRGITELPAVPVDASNQIAQTCPTNGNIAEALGEFVVTGRGGLPANPTELLSGDAVLPRLSGLPNERTEARTRQGANPEVNQPDAVNPPPPPIVEAQGWQIDTEGNVALIAAAPSRSSAFAEVQCHSSD